MTALLDTHVILWFLAGDMRLSQNARDLIESANRTLYLSSIVAAEISMKHGRGKLKLPEPPKVFLPKILVDLRLSSLEFSISHGSRIGELPDHHRDPFDRILVTQALYEKIPIVTADNVMPRYGVQIIW
jgi:PIN domain nuclease of toxin-antitoxin system